jgi:hypothetical protein
VIPEEARGQPLEIWFQDEARIGQKGTLAYVWARRGTRPRAVQDTRYASAYLFGAVCPQRGVGAGLVMPRGHRRSQRARGRTRSNRGATPFSSWTVLAGTRARISSFPATSRS